MLSLAIEAEVAAFLALHVDCVDPDGASAPGSPWACAEAVNPDWDRAIEVRRPRVRNRGADEEGERIRFTSAVLRVLPAAREERRGTTPLALPEGDLH